MNKSVCKHASLIDLRKEGILPIELAKVLTTIASNVVPSLILWVIYPYHPLLIKSPEASKWGVF